MPYIFFVLVVIVPGVLSFLLFSDGSPFLIDAISSLCGGVVIGYAFRERIVGYASIPSNTSFELIPRWLLATSAGLSFFAGMQFPSFLSFEAIAFSTLSAIVALREGPVYGWNPFDHLKDG